MSDGTDKKINFRLNTHGSAFDVDTCVPLGLIINEAITNSIKHAFKGYDDNIISLEILFIIIHNI